MARNITSAVNTEFQADELSPILLFEGVFDSGTVNFWSGIGDLSWDSKTWTGIGQLGNVTPVTETDEVRALSVDFQLDGIQSAFLALALGDVSHGNKVSMWVGVLDTSGSVIADPYKLFSGLLDVPSIEDSGETGTIRLRAESDLIVLDGKKERRYTDEDHQNEYPGDLFFQYVSGLQDKEIPWGNTKN